MPTPQTNVRTAASSTRTETLSTERRLPRFYGLKSRIMLAVIFLVSLFAFSSCDDRAERIQQIDERLAQIEDELSSQRAIYWGAPILGGFVTGASGFFDGGAGMLAGIGAAYEADDKIEALKRERERLKEERRKLSR